LKGTGLESGGVPAIEIESAGEGRQTIIDAGFDSELDLLERLQSRANAQK
jgi:hypothetical protein